MYFTSIYKTYYVVTKINTDIQPALKHLRLGLIPPVILLRIDQLSHVNPGPTVRQEHGEQDEAVCSTYEDDT